ncbi:uncharacterized protein LOC132565161 isoform X2 [Ylistrum balloti]|nr:uncharacterized protein LOC132565161 isoform X2 [Ylistrum balloti]
MTPVWFYQVVLVSVLYSFAGSVSLKTHSRDNTLYVKAGNNRGDNVKFSIKDSGHAVNCGPAANKMDFSWSPKILHPSSKQLTVNLDMLATVDLDLGQVFLNATDKMAPDTPIFQVNRTGGCQSLQSFGFKNLSCPVKTNDTLKTYITKTQVPTFPEGEFIITIVVYNEKKEMFLCLKADITVQT